MNGRHAPRCSLCGAPTRSQLLTDSVRGLVCVSCGSATLEQAALAHLLTRQTPPLAHRVTRETTTAPRPAPTPPVKAEPPAEDRFEEELKQLRLQRHRQFTMTLGLLTLLALFALSIPAGFLVFRGIQTWRTTQAVAALEETPSLPRAPLPVEPVQTPAEPEEAPAPIDTVEGEGEGAEPQVPAEAGPRRDSLRSHIDTGWKLVSSDPAAAARSFERALAVRPRHPEAHYGLGYALLKQHEPSQAAPHLCAARTSSDQEIQREVKALLANNALTCSP